MNKYSINLEQDIVDIADAIRAKNGTDNTYTVKQMPAAIAALSGSSEPAPTITVDSALSSSSENPVQNKVINSAIESLNTALNGKTDIIFVSSTDDYTAGTSSLATGRVAIVYEAS